MRFLFAILLAGMPANAAVFTSSKYTGNCETLANDFYVQTGLALEHSTSTFCNGNFTCSDDGNVQIEIYDSFPVYTLQKINGRFQYAPDVSVSTVTITTDLLSKINVFLGNN